MTIYRSLGIPFQDVLRERTYDYGVATMSRLLKITGLF